MRKSLVKRITAFSTAILIAISACELNLQKEFSSVFAEDNNILFSTDDSSSLDNWSIAEDIKSYVTVSSDKVISNDASASSKTYHLESNNGNDWSNYEITSKLKFNDKINGNTSSISFLYKDESDYYQFGLTHTSGYTVKAILKYKATTLKTYDTGITAAYSSDWQDVKISVQGTSIKCYVNDNLMIDYTETNSTRSTSGKVGIRSYKTNTEVKDYQVRQISPSVSITSPSDNAEIKSIPLSINGTYRDADSVEVTVSGSSSPLDAVLNNDGTWTCTVNSLQDGNYTISAKAVNSYLNKFDTASVAVTASLPKVAVSSLTLSNTSLELDINEEYNLSASVLPENAYNKKVNYSSSNTQIVTVSEDGTLKGISEGTATITAVSDDDDSISDTCTVNVNKVLVNSISLNKSSVYVQLNHTYKLVSTVLPENATNKTVSWSSSDESVAIVDDAGLVTALKKGTATITATCDDDNTLVSSCKVSIINEVEGQVYYNDFENSISDLNQKSGEWTEIDDDGNKVLFVDSTGKSSLAYYDDSDAMNWDNYEVSADIKTISGSMGLVFRYTDEKNFYHLRISGTTAELYKWVNGTGTCIESSAGKPWNADEWNKMIVKVEANNIQCFVNDERVFNVTDSSFSKGTVGFRTYGGKNYFDNLQVLEIIPKVSISAPEDNESITECPFTISGTSKHVSAVKLTIGDQTPISIDTDGSGDWHYVVHGIKNGNYKIKADVQNLDASKTDSDTVDISVNLSSVPVSVTYNNGNLLGINPVLDMTFATAMNSTYLTSDNIRLIDNSNNQVIPCTIVVSDYDTNVTLTPNSTLKYGTSYSITINENVVDLNDCAVSVKDGKFTFTTYKDVNNTLLAAESGEEKVSLNGKWDFLTDPSKVGEREGWYKADYSTDGWDKQTVPGNWDTRNEYARYVGTAWYKRTVDIPENYAGYPIKIHFGAAYHETNVWVNGTYVGKHTGGYTPFEFDIADYLLYGQKNQITISVDNTYSVGAWWKWGGLSRDVDLLIYNNVILDYQHIDSDPDLNTGSAVVNVKYQITNDYFDSKELTVKSEIYDKSTGELVWSSADSEDMTTKVTVAGLSTDYADISTTLPSKIVKLWHFDHPNLYTMKSTVYDGNKPKQTLTDNFGIRKIEVTANDFILNGEAVRLVGTNRVWDDNVNGNVEPLELLMRDVDDMKALGVNCARLNHCPPNPQMLDYCDEVGILSIGEFGIWGDNDCHVMQMDQYIDEAKQWFKELVDDEYNHPSIFAWSVGNEYKITTDIGKAYTKEMIRYGRQELDSSRLYTLVSKAGSQGCHPDCDFVCLNLYGGFSGTIAAVHKNFNKPVFLTEYGMGGAGFNNEDPNLGVFKPKSVNEELKSLSYAVCTASWTYNDYRSPFSNTPASENRPWGIVDVWRNKKIGYDDQRKVNSPVKTLSFINSISELESGRNVNTTFIVEPRPSNYVPHYIMTGYKLKYEIYNIDNNIVKSGIIDMPTLSPGDSAFKVSVPWTVPAKSVMKIKATVVTPLNYEIDETNVYYSTPSTTSINDIVVADSQARISFDHIDGATKYVVYYGTSDNPKSADYMNNKSIETINSFVDVTGLTNGTTYYFTVKAKNGAGLGQASSVVSKTVTAANELLPPKIWGIRSVIGGFYVGYSVDYKPSDVNNETFTIEYGTESGNYTNTTVPFSDIKGTYNVSGLEEGKTYYFRMKRTCALGTSDYSEEYSVTTGIMPSNTTLEVPIPAKPEITAIGTGANQVTLSFKTVDNAIGYKVMYGTSADNLNMTQDIHSSIVGQYVLSEIDNTKTYYFKIQSYGRNGSSDYSDVVSTNLDSNISSQNISSALADDDIAFISDDSQNITVNITSTVMSATTVNADITLPEGFTADKKTDSMSINTYDNKSFTFSISKGNSVKSGNYSGTITVEYNGKTNELPFKITAYDSTKVIEETFDEALSSDWVTSSGTWSVNSGKLNVTTNADASALGLVGDKALTDCLVSTDIKVTAATGSTYGYSSGLVFRATDSKNFYHVRIGLKDGTSNRIELYKWVNGSSSAISSVAVNLSTSNTYNLKVVAIGTSIKVYLDNTLYIDAKDSSLTAGSFGYRIYSSKATLDNFAVYEIK